MIKLVVFDWNGVIIADAEACLDADNYAIKKFGGRPMSKKERSEAFVIPASTFFIRQGVPEAAIREHSIDISRMFHEYYEKRANSLRTRRGARDLLEWLKQSGVTAIILSNHTRAGIELQLERLKLRRYFTSLLANEQEDAALTKKGKGEKLRAFLKNRHYKRNEVLIIGDSPEEMEIGRSLGFPSVAITGGYCSTKRLVAAKPDRLIHNLREMIPIIKSR
ncbi:MAG: HAD family hydrolase [Parcubacteria group bacterium]|nr:HAD family hydrolase [Parcubacteria group bacterium]